MYPESGRSHSCSCGLDSDGENGVTCQFWWSQVILLSLGVEYAIKVLNRDSGLGSPFYNTWLVWWNAWVWDFLTYSHWVLWVLLIRTFFKLGMECPISVLQSMLLGNPLGVFSLMSEIILQAISCWSNEQWRWVNFDAFRNACLKKKEMAWWTFELLALIFNCFGCDSTTNCVFLSHHAGKADFFIINDRINA